MIDERELLALTDGVLTPLALAQNDEIGDNVIEAVGKVVDEWVFDMKGLTLPFTDDETVDDRDWTTVVVDVIDASIETVIV